MRMDGCDCPDCCDVGGGRCWGVARSIVTAWFLTLPAAGATAAVAYLILNPILG